MSCASAEFESGEGFGFRLAAFTANRGHPASGRRRPKGRTRRPHGATTAKTHSNQNWILSYV